MPISRACAGVRSHLELDWSFAEGWPDDDDGVLMPKRLALPPLLDEAGDSSGFIGE